MVPRAIESVRFESPSPVQARYVTEESSTWQVVTAGSVLCF